MKNKLTKLSLAVFFLSSVFVQAQTDEERLLITRDYNIEFLNEFRDNVYKKEVEDLQQAISKATSENLPLKGVTSDGRKYELVGLTDDGQLKYYITSNNTTPSSIKTARVDYLHNGGELELNIEGQTMSVGIWDGGKVYAGHSSLGVSRVINKDLNNSAIDDHASHVAGTMVANASIPNIKGMAPQANLWANDWQFDISEMTTQASQGLLVSNHSYGTSYVYAGYHNNPGVFGRYGNSARVIDQLLFTADKYLPVYAAGNARNGMYHDDGQMYYFNTGKGGADLMEGEATSKNAVVVAAVNGIENYTSASDVQMSGFSQWGPTDDFRIKPDISAKGVSVNSVGINSETDTETQSGTSMAAPAVSGVFILWQQYYNQLYPTRGFMRAATLKALMAISADEAGSFMGTSGAQVSPDGPDHRFGWGLINAKRGAEILRDSKSSTAIGESVVYEGTLSNQQVYEIEVEVDGTMPLKAALAWTDPAGTAKSGTDDNTPVLVNDLDLRIIRQSNNQEILPWALNKSWSNIYASKTDNNVDPIEVVEHKGAATGLAQAGMYTIRVSHKGTLTNGNQKFSLIVHGIKSNSASIKDNVFKDLVFYPNPVNDELNITADMASVLGADIQIFDITGKKVYSNNQLFSVSNNATLNISHLEKGLYIVRLSNNNASQEFKIVKK